jgi:ferrous iron transport protein B
MESVILVGNPNVGKSLLFYHLTGNYVTVSNYPGTTVEVSGGKANIHGKLVRVLDTPGMYSLSPVTEEEAVTRRLLMDNAYATVVHVVDAKNLPRMLPLTLELLACGFRLILVLNMMDEAAKLGVRVNRGELGRRLGVPVLEAVLTEGRGVSVLKKELARSLQQRQRPAPIAMPATNEEKRMAHCLQGRYPFPGVVIGRLFLEGDSEIISLAEKKEDRAAFDRCRQIADSSAARPLLYEFALLRRQYAGKLLDGTFSPGADSVRQKLSERLTLDPVYGMVLMAFVLYVGLYLVVGRFGAGTLVDLLQGTLFGKIIIPILERWVESYVPWEMLRDVLAGEYGIMTMGFRYAFGIILPIVGTFFFMFSVLEDSGYLPRLAYLCDGLMRKVGLNGRAVIPLTLGFGCGTMAVLVTRTLESKRERFIATFLLALAVPCSAQLGLMLSILAQEPYHLFIWTVVVGGMFLFSGSVLDILLPGRRAPFFMEVPPLRMPKLNAIFQKTLARMRWYFLEIIPVFVLISVILCLLQSRGGLDLLSALLSPVLGSIGLPPELGIVFLAGFFRRDYGAAGLFDLYRQGSLHGGQLLVAAVVMTLFLPCLAQLAVMFRERKLPGTMMILAGVALITFCVGLLLRIVLGLPQI